MSGQCGGRIAIVTRAGRGIGRGIAPALARHGFGVALVEISLAGLERTAAEVAALGVDAIPLPVDPADHRHAKDAADAIAARRRRIVVPFSAGGGTDVAAREIADWRRVIEPLDIRLDAAMEPAA